MLSLPSRVQIIHQLYHAIGQGAELFGWPIRTLEELFKRIDRDGSNGLSHAEFRKGLDRLDIVLSEMQATELEAVFDVDGDDNITLDEFLRICEEAHEA